MTKYQHNNIKKLSNKKLTSWKKLTTKKEYNRCTSSYNKLTIKHQANSKKQWKTSSPTTS